MAIYSLYLLVEKNGPLLLGHIPWVRSYYERAGPQRPKTELRFGLFEGHDRHVGVVFEHERHQKVRVHPTILRDWQQKAKTQKHTLKHNSSKHFQGMDFSFLLLLNCVLILTQNRGQSFTQEVNG